MKVETLEARVTLLVFYIPLIHEFNLGKPWVKWAKTSFYRLLPWARFLQPNKTKSMVSRISSCVMAHIDGFIFKIVLYHFILLIFSPLLNELSYNNKKIFLILKHSCYNRTIYSYRFCNNLYFFIMNNMLKFLF